METLFSPIGVQIRGAPLYILTEATELVEILGGRLLFFFHSSVNCRKRLYLQNTVDTCIV